MPDELLALPNVALTPHIAGGTLEAQTAMQDMVFANLEAFFAGRPVLNIRSGNACAQPRQQPLGRGHHDQPVGAGFRTPRLARAAQHLAHSRHWRDWIRNARISRWPDRSERSR